jgi:nucleoid-associated protein YgaU
VVQPGENLFRIALWYDNSWDNIARSNGIVNPNWIYAGQLITITAPPPPPPPALPTVHTVCRGDNLYQIGRYYQVPWPTIAEANGIINPNLIVTGSTLTIPAAEEQNR